MSGTGADKVRFSHAVWFWGISPGAPRYARCSAEIEVYGTAGYVHASRMLWWLMETSHGVGCLRVLSIRRRPCLRYDLRVLLAQSGVATNSVHGFKCSRNLVTS